MIGRAAVTLLILGLAGCSNGHGQAPAAEPEQPAPNHWTVIPTGESTVSGTTYFHAWRLDTQTGELAFCEYDPGGAQLPNGTVTGASLNCSTSDKP